MRRIVNRFTWRPGLGALALSAIITTVQAEPVQSGAPAMTLPACAAYQQQRPRGGDPEQLSDLFGLSIYRWREDDLGRYRDFLLDCKRSLPGFREEMTLGDWASLTEKTVAGLRQYTGAVNRLGESMANHQGPRPGPGEPDYTLAFRAMGCDRFRQASVNAWARGGPPDAAAEAPFGVPLAAWRYEVWRAFENRVLACGRQGGSAAEADPDWMRAVVGALEGRAAGEIRQAQQEVGAARTTVTGILGRAAEAEAFSAADQIAAKLQAIDALAAAGPRLAPAEAAQVAAARERVTARLRAARVAEAEAWERDRPAREARARRQEEDLASLQRQNRERAAQATAERERTAKIEAERQATARLEAEQQVAEAAAQRRRDEEAKRAAEKQAQEKAYAEAAERFERENEARLASDPCNKIEVRRRLMEAANTMMRAQLGGRTLVDLTNGRTLDPSAAPGRSCLFVADWSTGEREPVTVTLRKNSFGEELIEVR